MAKLEFLSVKDVEDHKWLGNHHEDGDAFDAAWKLAVKLYKSGDIEGARKVCWLWGVDGMGLDEDPVTDEQLLECLFDGTEEEGVNHLTNKR